MNEQTQLGQTLRIAAVVAALAAIAVTTSLRDPWRPRVEDVITGKYTSYEPTGPNQNRIHLQLNSRWGYPVQIGAPRAPTARERECIQQFAAAQPASRTAFNRPFYGFVAENGQKRFRMHATAQGCYLLSVDIVETSHLSVSAYTPGESGTGDMVFGAQWLDPDELAPNVSVTGDGTITPLAGP